MEPEDCYQCYKLLIDHLNCLIEKFSPQVGEGDPHKRKERRYCGSSSGECCVWFRVVRFWVLLFRNLLKFIQRNLESEKRSFFLNCGVENYYNPETQKMDQKRVE